MFTDSWEAYIQYLHDWAVTHRSKAYEGCCPVCYDEFLMYEWEHYAKED